MATTKVWTRDEVLALPDDGQRYELVDGELLVSPSPRWLHQHAVGELYTFLRQYVEANGLGVVVFSPADLDLRADQLVQPDLFVVGPVPSGGMPSGWEDVGIPLLTTEVLSPSTALFDRVKKRRLYQRVGVPVYWIVDLDARLVEVWTPDAERPVIVDGRLDWQPDPEVPALEIDLPGLFLKVWGS